MALAELLRRNRSYRRFHQDQPLDEQTLTGLVELTRLCASAANRQPLKYLISWEPQQNAAIFRHLRWAAALAPWPGPAEGERPTGYVVILGDTRIANNFFIAQRFEILLVLALGRPKETVVLEFDTSPDEVPYWRDADEVHHVPKRPLAELLARF